MQYLQSRNSKSLFRQFLRQRYYFVILSFENYLTSWRQKGGCLIFSDTKYDMKNTPKEHKRIFLHILMKQTNQTLVCLYAT